MCLWIHLKEENNDNSNTTAAGDGESDRPMSNNSSITLCYESSAHSAFSRKAAVVPCNIRCFNASLNRMPRPLWCPAHWALWPRCDEGEGKLLLTLRCRRRGRDLDRLNVGKKKKKAALMLMCSWKMQQWKRQLESSPSVTQQVTPSTPSSEKIFCRVTFTSCLRVNTLSWRHEAFKQLSALCRFADQRRPVGGA